MNTIVCTFLSLLRRVDPSLRSRPVMFKSVRLDFTRFPQGVDNCKTVPLRNLFSKHSCGAVYIYSDGRMLKVCDLSKFIPVLQEVYVLSPESLLANLDNCKQTNQQLALMRDMQSTLLRDCILPFRSPSLFLCKNAVGSANSISQLSLVLTLL